MSADEHRLATARALHDGLVSLLWDAQGYTLAEAATGAVHADTLALVAGLRDLLARIEGVRDEAFALVAAARSAASPLRLVLRELTGAEAWSLAQAERELRDARAFHDTAADMLVIAFDDVTAAVNDPLPGVAECAAETLAFAREAVDDCTALVSAALTARAPLLAARWQEASP